MGKKIIGLLTVLCAALFLMPASAFADDGVTFSALAGTGGTGNEGYAQLVDGDVDTKWCCAGFSDGAYVVVEASEAICVSGYTLTTGNDNATCPGRNPKTWTLYGCNDYNAGSDSGTWTQIHSVTDDGTMQDVNHTPYSFDVPDNESFYCYYKLEVTAIHEGDVLQLSEMGFSYTASTCDHVWTVQSETPATCMSPKYVTRVCSGGCGVTKTVAEGEALGHEAAADGTCVRCGKRVVEQVGAFTVSGGVKGEDYSYESNVLKILTSTALTIRNTDSEPTTTDRIVVAKNVPANVVLAGVNIDMSGTGGEIKDGNTFVGYEKGLSALEIEHDSTVDVTISLLEEATNVLKGGYKRAALQKTGSKDIVSVGKLRIEGTGTLYATGGYGSAGIGCCDGSITGGLEIASGTIIAQGGDYAPGIGGGRNGVLVDLTISGGFIQATGGEAGAGIGGAANGNAYTITILGGTIIAQGGSCTYSSTNDSGAAGIGCGWLDYSPDTVFTITGGTITAIGGPNASGIGKSSSSYGDPKVIISGGSVKAASATEPKNEDGQAVYPLTIPNPQGKQVYIDGKAYSPSNHVAADKEDTNLYVWLTAEASDGVRHTVELDGRIGEVFLSDGVLTLGAWQDVEAPVVSGIEDGKTYCGSVSFTASDNVGIASVTAGGKAIESNADGSYTLNAGLGKVTVVVADAAGNKAELVVTVNEGHTPKVAATCISKAICDVCGEEYGGVDVSGHENVMHVDAKAATCDSEGNIEYWRCGDCGRCYADKELTREIAAGDVVIAKLVSGGDNVPPSGTTEIPECGDDVPMSAAILAVMALSGCTMALFARRRAA